MSRNYDNWEKLVGAVLRRQKDRQLAYCESFSTSYSADLSSRFSFDSAVGDVHQLPPVSTSSRHKFDPTDPSSENVFLTRDVKAIEFEEIRKATKNFRRDLYLGEGRFGPVFKGLMGSGIAVAVHVQGSQGHDEWMEHINYLSQLRHPNLVQLIGYSFYTSNRFLVYEYVPKGSLNNHLFARRHESLSWATRIKVALGAARAVAFLHGLEIPVNHRNIKSGYILLDADFNPRLLEFGPTSDMTHIETEVVGTCGYGAPEHVVTGNWTTRCDVYNFGVVLVELVTGLEARVAMRPGGKQYLMDWVKPYLKNKKGLLWIMDRRLNGQYPPEEAYKVARIGLQCASFDPNLRPRMNEVVAALEKL